VVGGTGACDRNVGDVSGEVRRIRIVISKRRQCDAHVPPNVNSPFVLLSKIEVNNGKNNPPLINVMRTSCGRRVVDTDRLGGDCEKSLSSRMPL
jgi:hypothetical protein